jgi:hypothetical protein
MKNIALALALVLAGSSLVGLASTDANAGARNLQAGAHDAPDGRQAS